jgi:hypothetical protein
LPQFAAGVKRLKALKIFQILNFRQHASRPDLRRFCSARFRNARICRRIVSLRTFLTRRIFPQTWIGN